MIATVKLLVSLLLLSFAGCTLQRDTAVVSLRNARIKNGIFGDYNYTVSPERLEVETIFPGTKLPEYLETEPVVIDPKVGVVEISIPLKIPGGVRVNGPTVVRVRLSPKE